MKPLPTLEEVHNLTDERLMEAMWSALSGCRLSTVMLWRACREECLKRMKRGHIVPPIHSGGSDPT